MLKLFAGIVVPIAVFQVAISATDSLFLALIAATVAFILVMCLRGDRPQVSPVCSRALPTIGQTVDAAYSVVSSPQQLAAPKPPMLDASTTTGEQMYYEMERKAINDSLSPFGFMSSGNIMIRKRAVVYPLIYSRKKTDGKNVKIKVQQIEEHILSLAVDINILRGRYGYTPVVMQVDYSRFSLIVNAINENVIAWSECPQGDPMQAVMGLSVAAVEESPIVWDISDSEDEYFSMLLGGIPKSGKTMLIRSILLQLCRNMPPERLQLHIVENPKYDFEALRDLPHVAHYVPFSEALGLLKYVKDELCQGKPDASRPYHVVVIDEIQTYAKDPAYRDEFLALSQQILSVGRARRVRIIYATPRPSANMLSNDIMELFNIRLAGKLGAVGSKIILGNDNAERLGVKKGNFIIKQDGIETMFYGYLLTDDDMQREITEIRETFGEHKPLAEPATIEQASEDKPDFPAGQTFRSDVFSFVCKNMKDDGSDLEHGRRWEAYRALYNVSEPRSGSGKAARANLQAHIDYYRLCSADFDRHVDHHAERVNAAKTILGCAEQNEE